MPEAVVAGQPIHYEDSGGSGPAVVFSHGFLMDHEMFDAQVGALRPDYRCVAWDERGFGLTPADGPFTYWDSARDLLGLMDHLGIATAVLVGMSQGGFLSLRAALLAPERVRALVLIDTQAGTEDPDNLAAYVAMKDEWLANGPANVQDAIAGIILGNDYDPAPWFAKWGASPRQALELPFECLIGREDIHDRLSAIGCPALVIHGTEDLAIPMARAEELCHGLGGCEGVVRVAGAGHASNLTHPDEVNAVLRAFLDRHP